MAWRLGRVGRCSEARRSLEREQTSGALDPKPVALSLDCLVPTGRKHAVRHCIADCSPSDAQSNGHFFPADLIADFVNCHHAPPLVHI